MSGIQPFEVPHPAPQPPSPGVPWSPPTRRASSRPWRPRSHRGGGVASLLLALVLSAAASLAADTEPPRLWVDVPGQGQVLSGTVTAFGWATDASRVTSLTFQLDGAPLSLGAFNPAPGRADVCQVHGDLNDPNCPLVGWQGTFSTAGLANGVHTFAVTARDAVGNTATLQRGFFVANPTFSLAITPTTRTVAPGQSVTYTVGVTGEQGFTTPVALAVSGLPAGVTGRFAPGSVPPGSSSTLTLTAAGGAAAATATFTVTGSVEGQQKTAAAEVQVGSGQPVVTSVTPAVILRGAVQDILIRGSNFTGATVAMGTLPQDGAPAGRPFPTAQVVNITPAGTQLTARIDTRATGVDGFYNLAITTPGGRAAAQFRVVGLEPVIDTFTPSEPVSGRLHVLSILGVNLAGAEVIPNDSQIRVLDLDNRQDRSLTGLLHVASGAIGRPRLTILNREGLRTEVELEIRASPEEAEKTTSVLEVPGLANPGGVGDFGILLQEPRLLIAPGTFGVDPSGLRGELDGETGERNHICTTFHAGETFTFNTVLFSLLDGAGSPIPPSTLNALVPGSRLDFSTLTVAVSAFLQVRFTFRICENGLSDVSVCFAGGIAALIPAVGGQSLDFNLCLGIPGTTRALQASGGITNLTWGSTSPCVRVQDLDPTSNLGSRPAALQTDCCANADLSVRIQGVAFDRPFDVGGTVAQVRPNQCTPPPAQFALFLDVDNDNPYSTTEARPLDQLDDRARFVPGSALSGASLPDLRSQPQQVVLVAAFVESVNGQLRVVPPPSGLGTVSFALTNTSAFRGVAMNWPVQGDTTPDYRFGGIHGPTQATVPFGSDRTARVPLLVLDYGGFTTVEASPDNGATRTVVRLPKDDDGNLLPDGGWVADGVQIGTAGLSPAVDGDTIPVTSSAFPVLGKIGDGLSAFEEYRGFMTREQHHRTNPQVKDVFISSNVETEFAFAIPNLPLKVHRVWGPDNPPALTQYNPQREINFNFANGGFGGGVPGRTPQRAIRVRTTMEEAPMTGLYGVTSTTTGGNATPNETFEIVLYLDQFNALLGTPCNFTPTQRRNMLGRVFGHEVGHALHVRHRPTSGDPCTIGTAESIMSTGVTGAPGNAPVNQYNAEDRAQIRLHEKH